MVDLTKPKFSAGWIIGAIIGVMLFMVICIPAAKFISTKLSGAVSTATGGKVVLPTF